MSPVRKEIRALSLLALPVVIGQLGQMSLGMVDIWMVGHLGATALSAVALADVVLFGSFVLGMGLVLGIEPMVAQAHGAGQGDRTRLAMQRGMVVGAILTVPVMATWYWTGPILSMLGQKAELVAVGSSYARVQVWSVLPALLFTAQRQYFFGRGDTVTPTVIVLVANVFNYAANSVLIFGKWGFPALGVEGAGIATALTRTVIWAALAVVLFWRHGRLRWTAACFRRLGQVFSYGVPVATYLVLEVWAFSSTSLFAGWLPHPNVAAHIIVMRVASFSFMMPLGISLASAIRVGNLLGAGDRMGARRAAWVAMGLGNVVMAGSAACFLLFGEPIVRIFTDDDRVVALALGILPAAAAFQLFDGTQVVGSGVLRGMGRPRPAAYFNVVGYYCFTLPLAVWFGLVKGYGLPGIWWSMGCGLGVVAVCFLLWIRYRGPEHVTDLAIAGD